MKKTLLILMLVATGLELWGQTMPTAPGAGRRQRYGNTNNTSAMPPRYLPANTGGNTPAGGPGGAPAGAPGGAPGGPGGPGGGPGGAALSSSYSASSAFASQPEEMIQPGLIDFEGVEVTQVLDIYAKLVNRTLLRAQLPQSQIILKTQTPLTRTEAIQALQAVLALNGISLVNIGDKFVKVVPSDQAGTSGGELDRSGSTNLPALGSYVTHVVQLKYVKPSEMVQVIQPFSKLANSILPIDGNGILVLRDYAENVKRMLEMIEQVDVSVPAEYISEVIPIRYAKVDDIANALNSLGSGGGATVSIGTAPGSSTISGMANRSSGFGSGNGLNSSGSSSSGSFNNNSTGFGNRTGLNSQNTPNGTATGGSTFQQRLNNIMNATSPSGGGSGSKTDPIQLFGQTKIIPNESSSSLLIYATRADMEVIKGIIDKLDRPLAQVLVEAAIIDYSLGPNTFTFGASVAQNPAQNGSVIGGGGMNNGQTFASFVQSVTTNGYKTVGTNSIPIFGHSISSSLGTNGNFGNNLGSGASYFANIGPNWDVALTAAQSDAHASVIQRPRIQTSQAKAAQFFVGDTVPYVTGNSYGTAYGSGVSYSQLSVGVELDVTPFINPDGLVVMDIQQEIDDLNGYTTIDNVGQVPNTIKRTLNAEIAVRDRDTIMLGGFIKTSKSTSRSGVPYLMDIPILGNLFLSRSDSKSREELIVLMRPTVLPTPELAAKNTLKEARRLPGVAGTEADNAEEENKLIKLEQKKEMRKYKANPDYEGFFTPHRSDSDTNSIPMPPGMGPDNHPGAGAEEVTPVPVPMHPVVPVPAGTPANGQTPSGQNSKPASQPSSQTQPPAAPGGGAAPPLDAAARQQKAQAALEEKLTQPDANSGSN